VGRLEVGGDPADPVGRGTPSSFVASGSSPVEAAVLPVRWSGDDIDHAVGIDGRIAEM
jgi:hypothetical protein